jgi:hypothetical protein
MLGESGRPNLSHRCAGQVGSESTALTGAFRIRLERERGSTLAGIAAGLNRDRVRTAHGGARWYPSTVRAVLATA